jgi:hypothetical protein
MLQYGSIKPNLSETYLIHSQHAFKKIDKFSSIGFLGKQLSSLQVSWNVNLSDVIDAIENIFSRFLGLNSRFGFMLLWSL